MHSITVRREPSSLYENKIYPRQSAVDMSVSGSPIQQHGANVTNRFSWIQAFRAHVDTVLNAVTTKYAEGVIQLGQSLFCGRISTVGEKPVGLQ
jgi:hypothetical protein